MFMKEKGKTLAISIPTGIGLDIGGYAGDFGKYAVEFSKYFNLVINPNAVNGGILSAVNENMYYTEGYAFDAFLSGEVKLQKPDSQNKIGVIFDKKIKKDILNIHINTLNALKTVCGYDIIDYLITDENVGINFSINKTTKISSGNIENPKTLLNSAKKLIQNGADVIAIICHFDDYDESDDNNYLNGTGVDPIGGIEAVISHYLTKELKIMTAHSPAFSNLEISAKIENPKVASEMISSTYLPCIIKGLQYAPKITNEGLSNKDLTGLIVPSNALGSKGVLGAIKCGVPVYCVKNKTPLNVCCEKLGINITMEFENYESCLEHLKEKYL